MRSVNHSVFITIKLENYFQVLLKLRAWRQTWSTREQQVKSTSPIPVFCAIRGALYCEKYIDIKYETKPKQKQRKNLKK